MTIKKYLGAFLLAAAVCLGGAAVIAQVIPVPQVPTVGTTDLIQIIPRGQPTAQSVYATPQQINGVVGYVNGGIAVTAWTYTMLNSQTNYFIQPAGTLATGVLTMAPNPSDGQRACFLSTQTQTAITWTANTNQTMNNAPTAGVAMTPACMQYSLASATWYRAP